MFSKRQSFLFFVGHQKNQIFSFFVVMFFCILQLQFANRNMIQTPHLTHFTSSLLCEVKLKTEICCPPSFHFILVTMETLHGQSHVDSWTFSQTGESGDQSSDCSSSCCIFISLTLEHDLKPHQASVMPSGNSSETVREKVLTAVHILLAILWVKPSAIKTVRGRLFLSFFTGKHRCCESKPEFTCFCFGEEIFCWNRRTESNFVTCWTLTLCSGPVGKNQSCSGYSPVHHHIFKFTVSHLVILRRGRGGVKPSLSSSVTQQGRAWSLLWGAPESWWGGRHAAGGKCEHADNKHTF